MKLPLTCTCADVSPQDHALIIEGYQPSSLQELEAACDLSAHRDLLFCAGDLDTHVEFYSSPMAFWFSHGGIDHFFLRPGQKVEVRKRSDPLGGRKMGWVSPYEMFD